jgi:prophage tail gpP-like protein
MSSLKRPVVTIYIDRGNPVTSFSSLSVSRSLDSLADAFVFTIGDHPVSGLVKPFAYSLCEIMVDKALLLTGRVEKHTLPYESKSVTFEGRSSPGAVWVDTCLPEGVLQWNATNLYQLAVLMANPYTIRVINRAGPLPYLDKVAAEPGAKIFEFLDGYARKANVFLRCNEEGFVIIERLNTGRAPVATLIEGVSPWVSGSVDFNGSKRYSRYLFYGQNRRNPHLKASLSDRNIAYQRLYSESAEAQAMDELIGLAKRRRALDLAESVSLNVTVSGWYRGAGERRGLWNAGDIITLQSERLRVKKETVFVVREATLEVSDNSYKTSLSLVLPGFYNTDAAANEPWLSEEGAYFVKIQ